MMGDRFQQVLVRPPSETYAGCLRPDGVSINMTKARIQHQRYISELGKLGVGVSQLTPLDLPDSVFIEDTAVALGDRIILTRPGAMTRRQEVMTVADFFEETGRRLIWLKSGTLDGGDILHIGGYVLIGQSERTDLAGAKAMAEQVNAFNLTPFIVPVTDRVHLKTTCSTLDAVTILASQSTVLPELPGVRILRVPEGEELASRCVAYDRYVIMPSGNPGTERLLTERGFTPIPIELSEFEKGGGGATSLSIRF